MKKPVAESAMRRCLELAEAGRHWVSPNPMVGCVIVQNETIVGEGAHRKFGGPHAEVHALHEAGTRACGATLYVNLEPCAHYGKTPPCADQIIAAGVGKVVIASRDPNPLVRGRGIKRLRDAGITVELGVLREEAEDLNERFMAFMRTGMPFVGIKLAMTLDGLIADANGDSRWISSADSRARGHALRAQYDAILVGAETALRDDPLLTVRLVRGRDPIRVVLDGSLRITERLRMIRNHDVRTLVITSEEGVRKNRLLSRRLEARGVEVVVAGKTGTLSPKRILQALGRYGITSVLVEGGAHTAETFLEHNAVDRFHCFIAPRMLGEGKRGLTFKNRRGMKGMKELKNVQSERLGDDIYITGTLQ